ncbi:alpha/beta fold hydrolase [Spirosoma jeollabukense]
MYKPKSLLSAIFIGSLFTLFSLNQVEAQSKAVKNIVLVHGAFADGSSWTKIIPLLEAKGYKVTAIQNPLTSLKEDVAAAKRAIALQDGPVLLVGHSWGGVVISEAGTDSKVAGLVYIAAFAPDNGESLNDIAKTASPAPGNQEVRADAFGYLSLTPKGIYEDFAQDLPIAERKLILATQGQWAGFTTDEKVSNAAWRIKPSWYVVASQDRMINPDLERMLAKKIKAKTLEINASHVPMVSQPKKVASFIMEAASNISTQELVSK